VSREKFGQESASDIASIVAKCLSELGKRRSITVSDMAMAFESNTVWAVWTGFDSVSSSKQVTKD